MRAAAFGSEPSRSRNAIACSPSWRMRSSHRRPASRSAMRTTVTSAGLSPARTICSAVSLVSHDALLPGASDLLYSITRGFPPRLSVSCFPYVQAYSMP